MNLQKLHHKLTLFIEAISQTIVTVFYGDIDNSKVNKAELRTYKEKVLGRAFDTRPDIGR